MTLADLLTWLAATPVHGLALGFVAAYPILTGVMWTLTSLLFYRHKEREPLPPATVGDLPFVSVIVAAYDEEAVIESTVESLLAIDYPAYEVVVVDDGSRDRTVELLRPYAAAGRIRLIEKAVNEGKAMALNDAIPATRGEIVTIVDADIRPHPDSLRHLIPHFAHGRVAAVAGNPQVANTGSLLAKVQVTEFASIVSVLRRAQRVWGRILTVSGAVCAFRRSTIVEVGLFDPDMATEDIALTWKLQRRSMTCATSLRRSSRCRSRRRSAAYGDSASAGRSAWCRCSGETLRCSSIGAADACGRCSLRRCCRCCGPSPRCRCSASGAFPTWWASNRWERTRCRTSGAW